MKKRMIYVCSLGLLTASVFHAGTQYDGTLLVRAQENDFLEGGSDQEWGLSDSGDGAISSVGSQGEFELGDGSADDTEDIAQVMVFLEDEMTAIPLEEIVRLQGEEVVFLKSYEDRYFFAFAPGENQTAALHFNQAADRNDLHFYVYDAVNQTALEALGEDQIGLASGGDIFVNLDGVEACLVVLDHADKYPELEANIYAGVQESEAVSEAEAEAPIVPENETDTEGEAVSEGEAEPNTEVPAAPESDTEPQTEESTASEDETETDPVAETPSASENETEFEPDTEETEVPETSDTESEPETEAPAAPDTESEPKTEEPTPITLQSAEILPMEGLEDVPIPLLPYLDAAETVKVVLHYSDGSQQIWSGDTDAYGNVFSLTYEDTAQEDGSVSRTYDLKVDAASSEDINVEETSQTVVFTKQVKENIDDIKAQEKTKVGFSSEKNWLLVQSVPQVTGRYSLESFGRELEELYYLADGEEEAVKADGAFELTEGVTYTFLLKLAS